MLFDGLVTWLKRQIKGSEVRGQMASRSRYFRPMAEQLETRDLPSVAFHPHDAPLVDFSTQAPPAQQSAIQPVQVQTRSGLAVLAAQGDSGGSGGSGGGTIENATVLPFTATEGIATGAVLVGQFDDTNVADPTNPGSQLTATIS